MPRHDGNPDDTLLKWPESEPGAPPPRNLFLASQEAAPVPFTILRAVRGTAGTIIDFEWVYANPAALRKMVVTGETPLGDRLLARFPGHREHPDLFPRYVRTAETGQQSQAQLHYSEDGVEGYFRNTVARIGADLIGIWFEDITEQVLSEQALRDRAEEIEALYQNTPVGLALFDRDLRFLRINERLAEINGLPAEAHIGKIAWDIVPSLRAAAEPKFQQVLATGQTVETQLSGETPKAPGVTRWWHEKYYPVFDKNAALVAIGAVVEDITERKAAENILRLSAKELRHRIKNLVSVVICLANQTFDGEATRERLRDFEGRLRALDQANSLLGDENAWWASELGALTVRAFQGKATPDRFSIDGPEVWLAPRMTMAVNMTLHELVTNAIKYGALSNENGHVAVVWTIEEASGEIELHWRESGGPKVEATGQQGFGSSLIEQLLPSEGGAAALRLEPGGVHCTLQFKTGGETEPTLNA
ncbi:MAG: PAS domain-containing protein [Hyphomicrobium sp.]|jgi:two-component system CheB/CheR fusion protein|nr:PAS domain-containing protein [Hyphomicrobium sp.]